MTALSAPLPLRLGYYIYTRKGRVMRRVKTCALGGNAPYMKIRKVEGIRNKESSLHGKHAAGLYNAVFALNQC
jgi:hypothetical protein